MKAILRALDRGLAAVARVGMRCYQLVLSPLKLALFGPGCGCRFYPTCSVYARESLARHGFVRGMGLIFMRVIKCHPLHPGGVDFVPPAQNHTQSTPHKCNHG